MNDSRSSVRNRVPSADKLFAVWIANAFSTMTGSQCGRPLGGPFV